MGIKAIVAAVALAASVLVPAAGADEAQRLVLAREVIELNGTEQTLSSMFEKMTPLLSAQIRQGGGGNLTDNEVSRLTRLLTEEMQAIVPLFLNSAAEAYAAEFSEEQLNDMRAFFSSPTGQALRLRQEALSTRLEAAGQALGMQAALQAMQRWMRERGETLPGAPHRP